jgi:hypothetical protein
MISIHPQFIKDDNGEKSLVVLSIKEFDQLIEELEDAEDVRLYDEAKRNDDGVRIPLTEAFRMIEDQRISK